jgi:hypothetical protein
LLFDSGDFLHSCRRLATLRHDICSDDQDVDFNIFVVLDSETDHLPSPEARPYCSVEWLKKSDDELKDVTAFYRKEVVEACTRLVARFSEPSP